MSNHPLLRGWLLATPLVAAALLLHACAALPTSPVPVASATFTRRPTQAPTPIPPSDTPSPLPSPTLTHTLVLIVHRSETPTPTEPPLAISDPGLGYDCSQVVRLPVTSAEATSLAEALVASYKQKLSTEYIAIEDLWAVERLGEYAIVQLRITDEAAGVFVLRQPPARPQVTPSASPQGAPSINLQATQPAGPQGPSAGPQATPHASTQAEYLAGYVWGGWPLPSRFTLPEMFSADLPDAPPELFYCMSLEHFFFDIPLSQELDLSQEYSCSTVQAVPADSPLGWAVSQALLDYWAKTIQVAPVELDQVNLIQQQASFLAIQVRFLVNGRREPPEIFIAKQTDQGFEFVAQTGGGGTERPYLLRFLYAQDPSIPPELLACLNLDGWLLDTPTPTP